MVDDLVPALVELHVHVHPNGSVSLSVKLKVHAEKRKKRTAVLVQLGKAKKAREISSWFARVPTAKMLKAKGRQGKEEKEETGKEEKKENGKEEKEVKGIEEAAIQTEGRNANKKNKRRKM